MDFDEISEIFKVFKKLHTANGKGKDKTIFYKDINKMHGELIITNYDDTVDNIKLELINHLSLSYWEGLLVQVYSLDGNKIHPYPYGKIKDVKISLDDK